MKNTINYYYNLNIEYLHFYHQKYYFKIWYQDYVLLPCYRRQEELNALFELNQELIKVDRNYHQIIKNKENTIITIIENVPYVLLKLGNTLNKKVSLEDIRQYPISNSKNYLPLNHFSWVSLWSIKIDYIESQIEHTTLDYKEIFPVISYMIGMGENAISYVQNTLLELTPREEDRLVVSHRRARVTDDVFDYYNPLTLVVDHKARDIAEMLKSYFLEGDYNLDEIDHFLSSLDLSEYGWRLLYGRMLFPSFYFDYYEDLLAHNVTEKELILLNDRTDEYESYLNDIYLIIRRYSLIPPVDWLQNKRT